MKKTLLTLCMLFIAGLVLEAGTMHVGSGQAYSTVQDAVNAASSGDVILVHEDTYREEVRIDVDGITIKPYNNENVTMSGCEALLNWTHEGSGVYSTTMNWDVTEGGQNNQVFVDGEMLHLARWPNRTLNNVTDFEEGILDDVLNRRSASESSYSYFFDFYDSEIQNEPASRWEGAKVWLNSSNPTIKKDGQGGTGEVISINGNKMVVASMGYRIGDENWGLDADTRYYLFDPTPSAVAASGGVTALLDNGEWWKDGNTLYVKTFDGNAPASSLSGSNLVEAKKRIFVFRPESGGTFSDVTIQDLDIFGASVTIDDNYWNQTGISSAENNVLDGLNINYVFHTTDLNVDWQVGWNGRSGIILSGKNNTLKNSIIKQSAASAISCMGHANKIMNNLIDHINYHVTESGAINFGQRHIYTKDHVVGYNTITNTSHAAISIRNLENSNANNKGATRIHHNRIDYPMTRAFDLGAIDEAGEYGNYIRIDHNVISNAPEHLQIGIYIDFGDGDKNLQGLYIIDHNIIYNIDRPIQINSAKGWTLANNVMVRPDYAWGFTGREKDRSGTIRNCVGTSRQTNNYNPGSLSKYKELFTDPENGDFTIKAGATELIDQGVSVSPWDDDINGSAPDIGAVEYGEEMFAVGASLNTYTLTIVSEHGTATPASGSEYTENTNVDVEAEGDLGYKFDNWSGDVPSGHGNDNPVAIKMDADKTITANYVTTPTYTLTTNNDGNGSVSLDPSGGTYNNDTEVKANAEANDGYVFDKWTGDVPSGNVNDNPVTITMDNDKSITANFKEYQTADLLADAYVQGGSKKDINYGGSEILYVKTHSTDDEYTRYAYFKFDLTGLSSVTTAKFRVYQSSNNGSETQTVKLVNDNSWTEDGITFNNCPTDIGASLGSWSTGSDGWKEIDITDVVNTAAEGKISLMIEGGSNERYVQYHSKENTNTPELVIATSGDTPTATAGSNAPVCVGEDLNLTETGGDAVSWSWSGPNSFSSTNQNPTITSATSAASGTYTVTVTDGDGNTATDDVSVTVNGLPSVTAGSNSPVCEGNAINLTESGDDATSWSWSGPDSFSSTDQNPTISSASSSVAGTYSVTVTDANGCENTDDVTVTVNTLPVATAGSNSPVDEGNDINLTESGGDATSWNWSGPNNFSSTSQNPTISSVTTSADGLYTVIVTDVNGCENTDDVDVAVNTLSPEPGDDPVLLADAYVRGGAYADNNYGDADILYVKIHNSNDEWTRYVYFKFDLSNISSVTSATFRVYQSSNNGSETQTVKLVNDNSWTESGIKYSNRPTDIGDAVGSWTTDTDGWKEIDITDEVNAAAGGQLSLMIEGGLNERYVQYHSKENTSKPEIVISSSGYTPTATAGSNSPVCEGDELSLTESGGDATTWSWSGPDGFTSATQNPTITSATSAATGTYTVTITDSDGNTATDEVSVIVNILPTAIAGSNSPVVEGDDLNLSENGDDATSWSWSGPNSFSSTVQNPTIGAVKTSSEGMYTVTVMDENGCINTDDVDVTVNPLSPNDTIAEPLADAYVRGGAYAGNNYGDADILYVKIHSYNDEWTRYAYFKFDLSNISSVSSATFRVYQSSNNGSETQTVKLVNDNNWTESGITYSNRPTDIGDAVGSWTTGTDGWKEIDITDEVNVAAGGQLTLMIEGGSKEHYVQYHSKENTNKPELVMEGVNNKSGKIELNIALQKENNTFMNVFPNPVKEDDFYIKIQNENDDQITGDIMIFNIHGQLVYNTKINDHQIKIGSKLFEEGVYIIKFINNGKTETAKVIIE